MDDWKVEKYDRLDKRVTVTGPDEIVFYVDRDDVDPDLVDVAVHRVVEALNRGYYPVPPEWYEAREKRYRDEELREIKREQANP